MTRIPGSSENFPAYIFRTQIEPNGAQPRPVSPITLAHLQQSLDNINRLNQQNGLASQSKLNQIIEEQRLACERLQENQNQRLRELAEREKNRDIEYEARRQEFVSARDADCEQIEADLLWLSEAIGGLREQRRGGVDLENQDQFRDHSSEEPPRDLQNTEGGRTVDNVISAQIAQSHQKQFLEEETYKPNDPMKTKQFSCVNLACRIGKIFLYVITWPIRALLRGLVA